MTPPGAPTSGRLGTDQSPGAAGKRRGGSPETTTRSSSGPEQALPKAQAPALGSPTALALACWPDGVLALAVLSSRGVFIAQSADFARDDTWRLLAAPHAPVSRDLALTIAGRHARLAWSAEDGIHTSTLSRTISADPGAVHSGPTERIQIPDTDGRQPRFPLTALASDDETLDVVWTTDRAHLSRTTRQTSSSTTSAPTALPSACEAGERLRSLDVAATPSGKTAWLVCSTDRGRVLAARWDIAYDIHGPWRQLDVPILNVMSVAIACQSSGPTVILVGSEGELLSTTIDTTVRSGTTWHSIDPPASASRISTIAVASGRHTLWLAAGAPDRIWITALTDQSGWLRCGPPIDIPLTQ